MYEPTKDQLELLDLTFNTDMDKLPTISRLQESVAFDRRDMFLSTLSNNLITTTSFRMKYTNHSFVILSHEWISELVKFLSKYNKVFYSFINYIAKFK